jgi:YHS domain-containing protein
MKSLTRFNSLFLLILVTSTLLTSQTVSAQVDPVDKNGLAIGGYDLVSYFISIKPVKGYSEFASEHNGAKYLFSTADNKKKFNENPDMYLPQYDGYCALAIGTTAKKISIDPETYRITDGKLYLFFNGKSFSGTVFNSLTPWVKDEENLITKSNKNWPTVKQKKYKHEK